MFGRYIVFQSKWKRFNLSLGLLFIIDDLNYPDSKKDYKGDKINNTFA